MISISDAIPVQFWLNGVASFNQKIEPGIERHCFHQLFNADDEIKIQFTDTSGLIYELVILDEEGDELLTLGFTEVDPGVYALSFIPEDQTPSITSEKIKLEIHNTPLDSWDSQASAADNDWIDVTYGNGLFVAVASGETVNDVMTSPDGITWTLRTNPVGIWYSVTYGNGLFVAVGREGSVNDVMTSPDGITWTARTSAALYAWQGVVYGNGLFVAVGSGGTGDNVMTSPDGITWTSRASAEDNDWIDVIYGNGLFVAVSVGGTNRVMTSPDGITWTSRAAAENNSWQSVTYGNGLFVAVAQDGTNRVMTSLDGVTWTARTAAEPNQWYSVTYGNGLFVAVAPIGTNRTMISSDGITWLPLAASVNNTWADVFFGEDIFVAVSTTGTGDMVMTLELQSTEVAHSDYISIKVNHARTKLIQYSNETDFAGINYDGIDPVPDFSFRVEAKFFKERTPEENESENLSDGSVVKLLGTAKKQKLLQVEIAPYYLHRKLTYILQHNSIYIDNLAWVKEESYETEDLDEHSAFVPGKTFLTQQDNSYTTNPFS